MRCFRFLCFLALRLRFLFFLECFFDPDELLVSDDESDELDEDSDDESEASDDDDELSSGSSLSISLLPSDE